MSVELNGHELPVDKQAAMSMVAGDHFDAKKLITRPGDIVLDILPKISKFHGQKRQDLSGYVYGHLKVIGYGGVIKELGKKPRWVARCRCGRFQLFTRSQLNAITSGKRSGECEACNKQKYLIEGYKGFQDVLGVKHGLHIDKTFDSRPPTIKFTGPLNDDLTGVKYSNIEVIGYYGNHTNSSRGGMWVVRCSCGKYELRRSIKLKQSISENRLGWCYDCGFAAKERRHEEYLELGYNKHSTSEMYLSRALTTPAVW